LVTYIGKILPSAVIAVLVIYCLKKVQFTSLPAFAPQFIGIAIVAALHVWKRTFLLSIGDYTIQLVKIEKSKGIIVAESDFSIVAYDKEMIAKLSAYLTVEGDSNKYYDSYTRKGSGGMTVWVQSPKGEVISGTMKMYKANYDGDIDKKSGIMENSFRTNVTGEPVKLWNSGGNPPPGSYHYEIIIDGNVVFDLKYIV